MNVCLLACSVPSDGNSGGGGGWFDWMPSWKPTSEEQLVEAERVVLKGKRGNS